MAVDAGITTFITGAAGFMGAELVKVLLAFGHRVTGLTPSMEEAPRQSHARAGTDRVLGALHE